MDRNVRLKLVKEGKAKLLVPDVAIPEHGKNVAFYNPAMSLDRDLSVLIVKAFRELYLKKFKREPRICDALTASGVRAIRYSLESGVKLVTACDKNARACEIARKNSELNQVEIEVVNLDANLLLHSRKFDVIDIDPFGSPARFIDAAAKSLSHFSLLMLTATDTATLFGVYPETCKLRYFCRSLRCQFARELGTRILLSFVIRALASHEKAFLPLLSYAHRHYVRVYGLVEKNKSKAKALLKKFAPIWCDYYEWHLKEKSDAEFVGELYLGKLHDREFLKVAMKESSEYQMAISVLSTAIQEIETPFYFDTHALAKLTRKHAPKLEKAIDELRKANIAASKCVFDSKAFKAACSLREVLSLVFK